MSDTQSNVWADRWRVKACGLLFEGFGVEDIAVKLSVPADHIRDLVRALRKSGRLLAVLFGGRAAQ